MSSTVSFSGKRVATTRARRSSRSACGISPVSGRIDVGSVDFSVTTDTVAPNVGGDGADLSRSVRPYTGRGSEPEESPAEELEAKRMTTIHPDASGPRRGAWARGRMGNGTAERHSRTH